MRSNRQIKKFSKQAMEILIRDFGYKASDFTLETSYYHRGKWPLVWTYWTAPCYFRGKSDTYPATVLLTEVLVDTTIDVETGLNRQNRALKRMGVRLRIALARKLVAKKGGA